MATYSDDLLDPLSRVRFMIQDTTGASFTDNEISAQLIVRGITTPTTDQAYNVLERYIAAGLLEAEAVKFARQASYSRGRVSEQLGQVSATLLATARSLRDGTGPFENTDLVAAFAGGQSIAEDLALRQDNDKFQPAVTEGADDVPGSSRYPYSPYDRDRSL